MYRPTARRRNSWKSDHNPVCESDGTPYQMRGQFFLWSGKISSLLVSKPHFSHTNRFPSFSNRDIKLVTYDICMSSNTNTLSLYLADVYSLWQDLLTEEVNRPWNPQKPVAIRTDVMFRISVTRIENHFSTAAWTPRNNSLHSYAPTNYLRFLRDGSFAWFIIPCASSILPRKRLRLRST